MLEQVTPIILTRNEAPNIGRTLDRLRWAREIVVVDSFSDDETLEVVSRFPQARVFQRRFDSHAEQWNFALKETGVRSEWVLALDADYVLTPALVEELSGLCPEADVAGYRANFVYCVDGRPLRGSAYPPVTVLYRRERAVYRQDGHTQRVAVGGRVESLRDPILHDDRKPLAHWLQSQARYMRIEARKLAESDAGDLNWADRLRKTRFAAPPVMLLYVLFLKRAILDGRAGLFYTFQRTVAELILSLYLVEDDMRRLRGGQRVDAAGQAVPAELVPEVKEQG
jgi:glycosyltransferase involved in cell wall biosynthesis